MNSGWHVHAPAPFCSLQIALAPHGEGSHGLLSSTIGSVGQIHIFCYILVKNYFNKNNLFFIILFLKYSIKNINDTFLYLHKMKKTFQIK